jgi:hypothetical protein
VQKERILAVAAGALWLITSITLVEANPRCSEFKVETCDATGGNQFPECCRMAASLHFELIPD